MLSQNKFPCTGCGCCCKRVKNVLETWGSEISDPEHILHFPYQIDESGKCEMLDDDNKCKVYENRPMICNIDSIKELFDFPEKEFYELNAKFCNQFMAEDGIPEELRFNLGR